jgi:hypothetical protein
MKFYFFIIFIIIQTYKNEKCEELKSCYNCTISSNNCFWANDLCYSSNEQFSENKFHNNNINKNNFTLFSFITSQYKCITNEKDIEMFKNLNNTIIALSIKSNTLNSPNQNIIDKINYHIYCFEYNTDTNILLSIKYNNKYIKNILQVSIYDNKTNSDMIINLGLNNNKINIESNFFCIKITYIIDNLIGEIISFHLTKCNDYANIINKKNKENIISYIILGSIIVVIIAIIWTFILCHKKKSGIMKEITIINKARISQNESNNETNEEKKDNNDCDNSNCSELQEKYFQMERKSFVTHNYETLYSFVHNIHDIEKKDIYLKTIIKTMPSFIIDISNGDLIGSFCSFCENKIKLNDNVCLLSCGHIFHYDCIYQQIITNEEYKCIICKENIII